MLTRFIVAFLGLLLSVPAFAQSQHSLFYEVSGNGLKKPSYLFGTFHLYTSSFVDSQKNMLRKFKATKAVAGEIVADSLNFSPQLLQAMQSDTPLFDLMSKEAYVELDAWMEELTGSDLSLFNNLSPMAVNAMLLQFVYAKNFPSPKNEQPMDVYLQTEARKRKMKVYGLESVQTQVAALFDKPLKRQAEQLEEFVLEKDSAVHHLRMLQHLYRNADYDKLVAMMYDAKYTEQEIKTMIHDRNAAWLALLPAMMHAEPTFVAVGAMHLAGETGLVEGLRKQGYTVTPLPLR